MGAFILLLGLAAYFFPTIIAVARHHHNALAVGMLNLFLGWTLLGWVGALVWACTQPRPAVTAHPVTGLPAPPPAQRYDARTGELLPGARPSDP